MDTGFIPNVRNETSIGWNLSLPATFNKPTCSIRSTSILICDNTCRYSVHPTQRLAYQHTTLITMYLVPYFSPFNQQHRIPLDQCESSDQAYRLLSLRRQHTRVSQSRPTVRSRLYMSLWPDHLGERSDHRSTPGFEHENMTLWLWANSLSLLSQRFKLGAWEP